MDLKGKNGHEFYISYKGTPMTIGLFLFSRLPNKEEVVLKEYYYPDQNRNNGLVVTERHLTEEYASLLFSSPIREHNGIQYKMQSLEGIYHSKKNSSRPKDQYDVQVIQDCVDIYRVNRLDTGKDSNYDIFDKHVEDSIVEELDNIIKNNHNRSEVEESVQE